VESLLEISGRRPLHRSLGAWQLTLLGVGTVIGTGIFVLTAHAAQKAGPAMMVSFVIAGFVCAVTALCYAELSSMVPVSGSAYTYCYAVFGEAVAWAVGWALLSEYAIAASAVSVGWSNYFVGFAQHFLHWTVPTALARGPFDGGAVNLPAATLALLITALLYIGTRESARFGSVLVAIKVAALAVFVALTIPVMHAANFQPFAPLGWPGIGGAAGSIVFAYIGFDVISTAAEETHDPQRAMPIALAATLLICTTFYLLVAAGAIGALGAQPIIDPASGRGLAAGSLELARACQGAPHAADLVCSGEALAHVLRQIGWARVASLVGAAAFVALPSVVLMILFAQTRVFFVMSRDGLLPALASRVHARFHTPHVATLITGSLVAIAAACFPVGKLADLANAGTLFAFFMVAAGVLVLRRTQPRRQRRFRIPAVWAIAPVAMAGCAYLLYSLGAVTKFAFAIWAVAGLACYCLYGYRHSHFGRDAAERVRP
jgi:APA family basic amino acid/polyamine antiporter